MKTLNSGQFLRLIAVLEEMTQYELINEEEATALLAKTGYVKMGDSEWQHPNDGSVLKLIKP